MSPIWVCVILLSSFGLRCSHAVIMTRRAYNQLEKYGLWDGNNRWIPWDDFWHYPLQIQYWPALLHKYNLIIEPEVNGTTYRVPHVHDESPDFRLPEFPYHGYINNYKEGGRYYRLTPRHLDLWRYHRGNERPQEMACYCVMVYKRLTPLAMGAVLSMRHILTSAMATDLVLNRYKHKKTLENILGAWYNSDIVSWYSTNSVYYMTPARIIYHPRWKPPEMANRSHPIPCIFDLALWTATKTFFFTGEWWRLEQNMGWKTAMCKRWSNKQGHSTPPSPREVWVAVVVGCQMVFDIDRKPFPWFKYGIRHNVGTGLLETCPKTDWDWYICTECNFGRVMRFGADVGAALHLCLNDNSWRVSGLAGLNAFSLRLRSKYFVNYFTVLDRHPVLDWLYDAVKCRLVPDFLDVRYEQARDEPLKFNEAGGQRVYFGDWSNPWEWSSSNNYNPYFN